MKLRVLSSCPCGMFCKECYYLERINHKSLMATVWNYIYWHTLLAKFYIMFIRKYGYIIG